MTKGQRFEDMMFRITDETKRKLLPHSVVACHLTVQLRDPQKFKGQLKFLKPVYSHFWCKSNGKIDAFCKSANVKL